MKAKVIAEPTLELPEAPPGPKLALVRADELSRNPESQIRIQSDTALVLEYAEAMLTGSVFPPIIVFEDTDGAKYLGDGHHRVDAAALAALKDTGRKPEILADVRPGTFEDALRFAMQANSRHGKRLTEKDHKRAIELAISHNLIKVVHAKDVVPEIVAMIGCSVRVAQMHSVEYRAEMIAKRDRLIWTMHGEGRSQDAIGAALEVDQSTVTRVVDRIMQKRSTSFVHKETRPVVPTVDWPEAAEDADAEDAADEVSADTDERPRSTVDLSPFLPLLERMRPLDEGGDDTESGAVGLLDDVDADEEDPKASALIVRMGLRTDAFLRMMEARALRLSLLRFQPVIAEPLVERLDRAVDYLLALKTYLVSLETES